MELKILSLGLVFAIGSLSLVKGLKCWNCNNAKSKGECLKKGRFETCQKEQQMSCLTEIRYGPRKQLAIFKRCKQKLACQSDEKQNKDQCVEGRRENVCRCCCRTSNCNKVNFWCEPSSDSTCKLLKKPKNGFKKCVFQKTEGEIGSKCSFSCRAGFWLKGTRISLCRRNQRETRFSSPTPACIRSKKPTISPTNSTTPSPTRELSVVPTTKPSLAPTTETTEAAPTELSKTTTKTTVPTLRPSSASATMASSSTASTDFSHPPTESPLETTTESSWESSGESTTNVAFSECEVPPAASTSGGYSCIRTITEVLCTYFCGEDQRIVGPDVLSCQDSLGWNGTTPECISECQFLPVNLTNGTQVCMGGGEIGTTCTFLCDSGFALIGEKTTTCVLRNGTTEWSSATPTCESREIIPR